MGASITLIVTMVSERQTDGETEILFKSLKYSEENTHPGRSFQKAALTCDERALRARTAS